MLNFVYLSKFISASRGNPSVDITTLYLRLVMVTCKSFRTKKVLNVDGVSTKSHQRCLPSSPKTVSLSLGLSQENRRINGQGLWTACPPGV